MQLRVVSNAIEKLLIVSNCHQLPDKWHRASSLIPNFDLTVYLGGIPYEEGIIQNFPNNAIYCLSDADVLHLDGKQNFGFTESWLAQCPNIVETHFANGNKILMTHGGITPTMTRRHLEYGVETSFVSHVAGKSWHHAYDGRFGYVVSNNPGHCEQPSFYPFSAQLGGNVSVYAQEANQFGLQQTVRL